jgi:hypothetical protein
MEVSPTNHQQWRQRLSANVHTAVLPMSCLSISEMAASHPTFCRAEGLMGTRRRLRLCNSRLAGGRRNGARYLGSALILHVS